MVIVSPQLGWTGMTGLLLILLAGERLLAAARGVDTLYLDESAELSEK